jgi:hypothetical protein
MPVHSRQALSCYDTPDLSGRHTADVRSKKTRNQTAKGAFWSRHIAKRPPNPSEPCLRGASNSTQLGDYKTSWNLGLLAVTAKMPSTESESPDESFFNDMSQQAQDASSTNGQDAQQDGSNKMKRIACVLCRKRKLRCDGTRPTCSTCKRLSHDCAYDEVRKKSGPKRGYVKLLEQRLREWAHASFKYSY